MSINKLFQISQIIIWRTDKVIGNVHQAEFPWKYSLSTTWLLKYSNAAIARKCVMINIKGRNWSREINRELVSQLRSARRRYQNTRMRNFVLLPILGTLFLTAVLVEAGRAGGRGGGGARGGGGRAGGGGDVFLKVQKLARWLLRYMCCFLQWLFLIVWA